MTSPLVIRAPEAEDFESIARLTNHFIETTAIHFGYEPQTTADHAHACAHSADRFPWLVALADGEFAGYAKSTLWRAREAYQHTCETSVYVDDRFHRRGVARALYERLFEELRERSFHVAVAGATLPNDASVKFHLSLGFEPVGTFPEVGRKFDAWHDVAWFWRKL